MEHLENEEEQTQSQVNPFDETNWVEPVNEENGSEIIDYNQQDEPAKTQDEDEIIDADEYLKTKLGFSNWGEAKEELERLRTEKESFGSYENETSAKIHRALSEGSYDEVYDFLDKDRKLNKLINTELNDDNAEEIVKLAMKSKYSNLTDDEINYKFRKQFSLPKEPEQSYDETDDDFEERQREWNDKVKDIKMELMIEAKTSRPQIEKLKSEIRLPNIGSKNVENAELSQEELANVHNYINGYYQSAESALNSFDGFNVEYKDEDVSLQTSYVPSTEEKEYIAVQMEELANNDFNANVIFAERWVNDDGTLKTDKISRDLALLYSEEKIMQKLVNDGVAKRLAEYRKTTSNIKVNGGQTKGSFEPKGNEFNKMADFFFGE